MTSNDLFGKASSFSVVVVVLFEVVFVFVQFVVVEVVEVVYNIRKAKTNSKKRGHRLEVKSVALLVQINYY